MCTPADGSVIVSAFASESFLMLSTNGPVQFMTCISNTSDWIWDTKWQLRTAVQTIFLTWNFCVGYIAYVKALLFANGQGESQSLTLAYSLPVPKFHGFFAWQLQWF